MRKTIFVVCQHGNEKLPFKVIKKYKSQISFILANKKAYVQSVRFVETDLNRSFPGKTYGSYEERLATKLLVELRDYQEIVDLHTATCNTPIFAIITKLTSCHLDLIKRLGISRIVYLGESIASGGALIDCVRCGVSIECGNERSKRTANDIDTALSNFMKSGGVALRSEYYYVYKILPTSSKQPRLPKEARNFHKISLAGKEFYPILARERNYKGILCLMAKKITYDQLMMLKSKKHG